MEGHATSRSLADKYEVQPTPADTELRITRTDSGGTVREVTDPAFWDNVTHRVGLIWDDMTRRHHGAGDRRGVRRRLRSPSLVALVIFVAGIKVWKGPDTGAPGESTRGRVRGPPAAGSAALLAVAGGGHRAVRQRAGRHAAGRGRAAWLLQPFFVVGRRVCVGVSRLRPGLRAVRHAGLLWSRGARSLWGSYLAISLYGLLVTLLFAVLPAASYAAHAVGVAGVLAPIGSLIAGRLLMTRAVTDTAERFELSKTACTSCSALVVAGLILFTMIEVGALAIDKRVRRSAERAARRSSG